MADLQTRSQVPNIESFLQEQYILANDLSGEVSDRISADNVLSTRIDTVSNAVSVVSQQVSILSQQLSILSQQISVLSAGLGGLQMRVAGNIQGISATALANISGLSASVASAAVYQIDGQILYRMSAANTVGFGLTFPTGVVASGRMEGNVSVGMGFVTSVDTVGYFDEAGSGSIIYSVTPAGTGTLVVRVEGLFQVSTTAGTIQLQARVSAAGAPVNIQRGSYLRAFKIV